MDLQKILLAEDDPEDIDLTLHALSEYNLANQVVVVRDGVEALDYLYMRGAFAERPNRNPVVVLLDLKMPRLDGISVLRAMKSSDGLKTIPIVILTSSRESQDLRECYQLGANAYVVKPVKFAEFIGAVKGLGLFWAMINEPPLSSREKA